MAESPSVKTPREMSSRLLTMKFMQRAVAGKASSSSPTTTTTPRNPKNGTRVEEGSDDDSEPSSKRRKTAAATPVGNINRAAVEAALQEQETRRQAALEKHTAELGDTHWVLDGPAAIVTEDVPQQKDEMRVVYVGYQEIDQRSGGGTTRLDQDGRIRTANFNKAKTEMAQQKQQHDDNSDLDCESESIQRTRKDGKTGGQDKKKGRRGAWNNDKKRKTGLPVSISAGGSR